MIRIAALALSGVIIAAPLAAHGQVAAERVIEASRPPAPTVFVPREVVQPLPANAGQVAVVRPGSDPTLVASSPFEEQHRAASPAFVVPDGARLVAFDREAWLGACRSRLASYEPDQRVTVMASLGGAAMGSVEGREPCETYLDSYLASAANGTLQARPAQDGDQFMLVPVAGAAEQGK